MCNENRSPPTNSDFSVSDREILQGKGRKHERNQCNLKHFNSLWRR